jgi:CheY-like chemotaxis protein
MAEQSEGTGQQKQERAKRFLIVVDGNARDSYATGLLLQQFGYNVCTLQTARQAQEIMTAAIPAVLITDLALPGTSGLDLLTQIRQNPRIASVPVIILTAVSDSQSEKRCMQAGCTFYLRKPVQAEDLYRAVQSAVEKTPRKSIRITTALKAVVGVLPGSREASEAAVITALSENGMFVKTMKPRPLNAQVSVTFAIRNRIITVEGRVLYSYPPGEALFRDRAWA